MWRNRPLALLGAGVALGLAGCGSAGRSSTAGPPGTATSPSASVTSSATAGGIMITPHRGSPRSFFAVTFVAPASSEPVGRSRTGYTVSLTGASGAGCVGVRSLSVPAATQGLAVTVQLDPRALGGSWCPGMHTARVIEIETPVCDPGTMCPEYVRVIGTVGEASFTVTGVG